MNNIIKYLKRTVLIVLSLILLVIIAINTTSFQNILSRLAQSYFSEKLQTHVSIDYVEIDLLNRVHLNNVYVQDQFNDTLLFAGTISTKITDWFVFKSKSEIEYINIENAVINFKRKRGDRTWNYDFIGKAFPSNNDKKGGSFPDINLKLLKLTNVTYNNIDDCVGSNMYLDIPSLVLQGDKIDYVNKVIDLESIEVDKLSLRLLKYFHKEYVSLAGPWEYSPFNPNDWKINLNSLNVSNSHFKLDNVEYLEHNDGFDGQHIDVKNINIAADNIYILQDTLFGQLNTLNAIEKSGLQIRQITADVKVSPNITELKNMILRTNRSTLKDYYAMVYDKFPAYEDYITDVEMVVDLKNSEIAMADIAFFAPSLHRWDNEIFTGNLKGRGTVPHLNFELVDLKNEGLQFKGKYYMWGLPEIETTDIIFKEGEIITNYQELIDLFPEIKALDLEPLQRFEKVHFKGDVDGYYDRLNIQGAFATNMGTLTTNRLALDYSNREYFKYKGSIQTNSFDLGKLFDHKDLGTFSMNVNIEGDGFNYKQNIINVVGDIPSFEYKQYEYKNASLDFKTKSAEIQARLKLEDEHADVDIVTAIKGLSTLPQYNVAGKINWIDLQVLHLRDDAIKGKGDVIASITGTNFKNIEGNISIEDLLLLRGDDTLAQELFVFESERNGLENNVTFKTPTLNINVNGTFYLDDLAATTQLYLSHYMSEFIPKPSKLLPNQIFNFTIKGSNPDNIISLFDNQLKLTKGVELSGMLDGVGQMLSLKGNIPFFQYKNFSAESISFVSDGDLDNLNINLFAHHLKSNQADFMKDIDFSASLKNNTLIFDINSTSNNALGTANIGGVAKAFNDSLLIELRPSEVYFNNNKWNIAANSKIVYANKYFDVDNLILSSNDQSIVINNESLHAHRGVLNARIDNVNIKPLLSVIGLQDISLEGELDGNITVKKLPENVDADFDLDANKLLSENHSLGDIRLVGNYNNNFRKLTLDNPSGMYDSEGEIELSGSLWVDENDETLVDFKAKANNASLKWAQPFTYELVKDLNGKVNGYLNVKNNFKHPDINGLTTIENGTFVPLITGVTYQLPNTIIDIDSKLFTIRPCELRDDENNIGKLSGRIEHQYFKNVDFRLKMTADNIKVLDKKEKEAENFYGKVYANATLDLRGLLTDLNMSIVAKPTKNSKLYIPLAANTYLDKYEYISFKKVNLSDDEKEQEKVTSKKTKLTVNMDAIATTDLEAEIILDARTGDVINTRGTGNLSLQIPSDGDLRLNGTYVIESGYYDFTLSQMQLLLYKNRFNINAGSTINWDGVLSKANLNIKGNTIKRARLYDFIVEDIRNNIVISDRERADAMLPQNFIVDLKMTGALLNPDLSFNLQLEETRSIGTYAYQKLQRTNSDERELVNQVVSLLLFNQFIPSQGFNSSVAVNTGVSSVAEMLSSFASNQINNFTNNVLGVKDLMVDLNYKSYNITNDASIADGIDYLNRNTAGVNVRKNLFKDRIILDVGGMYDWGRSSFGGNSITDNLTGNFKLDVLLSKQGKVRFNIFRNSTFDAISMQNVGKYGIGVSYRKSFNNIFDLLGIYNKPKTSDHLNEIKIPQELHLQNKSDTLIDSNQIFLNTDTHKISYLLYQAIKSLN